MGCWDAHIVFAGCGDLWGIEWLRVSIPHEGYVERGVFTLAKAGECGGYSGGDGSGNGSGNGNGNGSGNGSGSGNGDWSVKCIFWLPAGKIIMIHNQPFSWRLLLQQSFNYKLFDLQGPPQLRFVPMSYCSKMSFSGDQNGVPSTSSEFAVFDGVPGLDGVSSSSRSGGEHRGSLVGGALARGRGAVAEGLGSTLQAWGWLMLGLPQIRASQKNGWLMMAVENPFTMDDFRVPLFQVISNVYVEDMGNISMSKPFIDHILEDEHHP